MLNTSTYNADAIKTLLANLGTFWAKTVADPAAYAGVAGVTLIDEQSILDSANALAVISRFEIPAFSRKLWRVFSFSKTDLATSSTQPYAFGDSGITFDEGGIVFGQTKQTDKVRIKIDSAIVSIYHITDNPVSPQVIWTKDVDFVISDGYIVFNSNPFDSDFVQSVNQDGDTTLTMWFCNLDLDLKDVYNEFGYILSIYATYSADNYLKLVQAAFDSLIRGSNSFAIREYLASALNIKVVQAATETVEYILTDNPDYLQIVTDKNVYDFAPTATPIVAVGDVVVRGDTLTDTLRVFEGSELAGANLPFTFLAVEPACSNLKLSGTLIFKNQVVNTTYTMTNGFADVRFDIGGYPVDVAKFWSNAKDNSTDTYSIARSLRNTPGTAEPQENEVLTTVNPMQFLLDKVFNYNCIVASVKVESSWVASKYYLVNLISYLRHMIPAHIALFLVTEIIQGIEYNGSLTELAGASPTTMVAATTETTAPGSESCELFTV